MKIKELIAPIEQKASSKLQEEYDNSGLIVGCYGDEVSKALIALDCTEDIIDEAISKNCDIVITHHPILFSGLKKINGRNYIERVIIKAIRNKIAIYSAHTNLDNFEKGVNYYFAKKLGLSNLKILAPKKNMLFKLVVFCPTDYTEKVRNAIFEAGAGTIGDYDCCSFNIKGKGTFKASENTNPFVGEKGSLHAEEEVRIETVVPSFIINQVVKAMIEAHPYEEVAHDVYPIQNDYHKAGAGMVGELVNEQDPIEFLKILKEITKTGCIKHTEVTKGKIKRIALCGGSGSFLINQAKAVGADLLITGDIKYHQFFDAEGKIILADIGHFESEQFTMQLLFDVINEKFPKFAISISEVSTNPVKYFV